jgi:hypothetical protein
MSEMTIFEISMHCFECRMIVGRSNLDCGAEQTLAPPEEQEIAKLTPEFILETQC